VIVEANAVVDPRAVVVHFEDAHSTYAAMMASVWFILCAPLAIASFSRAFGLRRSYSKRIRASILRHVLPQSMTNCLPIWDGTRVCNNASHVANDQHNGRNIEADDLGPSPTDVLWALEQRHAMVKYVDEPKSSDLGADKEHR